MASLGPSSFTPLATIRSTSSGSGRCNSNAFGACCQTNGSRHWEFRPVVLSNATQTRKAWGFLAR